jgi:hypothetical protein
MHLTFFNAQVIGIVKGTFSAIFVPTVPILVWAAINLVWAAGQFLYAATGVVELAVCPPARPPARAPARASLAPCSLAALPSFAAAVRQWLMTLLWLHRVRAGGRDCIRLELGHRLLVHHVHCPDRHYLQGHHAC